MYTPYAVTGFSSASGRPWRTKLRTRPPGAVAKRLHLLIEQRADPDDLAPRDPQPKRLDELVDTPHTYACCTTATSACSERRRGSKNDGR
jgi:hypothetical protein